MGLMYRPRSSEKIMPRLPPPPLEAEDANFITSGSSATPSTSNMNSSGTAGAWSSCSSGCSSSSCSCSCSCGSSSSWSIGGGGGGGACIRSSSGGAEIWVPRGAMQRRTPICKSVEETRSSPARAALARATSMAKSSPRWPCTPARTASSQRYFCCARSSFIDLRYSRAKMMEVLIDSVVSSKRCTTSGGLRENSSARLTASSRSSPVTGSASAERQTPIRSIRCSRSSASSGLKVAISKGRHGWRTDRPSRSTVT
mmetsp:Transcript_20583/g.60725  ORF Transcript_20583/g.60725 Transcript_20583/m.60725 type:complete len:256 (+) Transcript_20583:423-1190(+)